MSLKADSGQHINGCFPSLDSTTICLTYAEVCPAVSKQLAYLVQVDARATIGHNFFPA